MTCTSSPGGYLGITYWAVLGGGAVSEGGLVNAQRLNCSTLFFRKSLGELCFCFVFILIYFYLPFLI